MNRIKVIVLLVIISINCFAVGSVEKKRFFDAIRKNDFYTVKLMLKVGIPVEIKEKVLRHWETALMVAARYGHLQIVKLLVKQGANVNASDKSGFTVLMWAVSLSHPKVVRFLVEKGSSIKSLDKDGCNVLHIALRLGRKNGPDVFEFLVSKGADIHLRDNSGETPLYNAAYWGQLKVAKLLISKGVKVDIVAAEGITPLMLAAQGGYFLLIKLFLEHGADKYIINDYGHTALGMATAHISRQKLKGKDKRAYSEIIKLLKVQ